MPATNNGTAAYQRAMRELREMFRAEFDSLLQQYNQIARADAFRRIADPNAEPQLTTTPYNAAMAQLRDKRHRKEFDELRESIKGELDGELDAAIESIRRDLEQEIPEPDPEPVLRSDDAICACSDPGQTHPPQLHQQQPEPPRSASRSVPVEYYSMALDEIYLLRAALADEARTLDGHLNFKTFPPSRRKVAEQQVLRMRGMAAGLFEEWSRDDFDPKDALRSADIDECMTRFQWERQRGLDTAALSGGA